MIRIVIYKIIGIIIVMMGTILKIVKITRFIVIIVITIVNRTTQNITPLLVCHIGGINANRVGRRRNHPQQGRPRAPPQQSRPRTPSQQRPRVRRLQQGPRSHQHYSATQRSVLRPPNHKNPNLPQPPFSSAPAIPVSIGLSTGSGVASTNTADTLTASTGCLSDCRVDRLPAG